jgi:hypothetical protein
MSDTISTTLSNIAEPSFFNSFFNMTDAGIQQCTMFQFKMTLFIIFIFILTSLLTGSFTMIFGKRRYKGRCPMSGCPCCKKGYCDENCHCGCGNIERFSNDSVYTYSDIVTPNYSNYQSTALTPENTEEGNPSSLLFGQANRIITTTDGVMTLDFNIFANLYVLNGNPFGQDQLNTDIKKDQKYLVYLARNGKDLKLIDELKKEQDGLYKMTLKTKDQEQIKDYMTYNQLIIIYKIENKTSVLLKGNFTVV